MTAIHFGFQPGSRWHVRHQVALRDVGLGPGGNSVRAALLETQAWKQGQASCEGNTTGGSVYSHLGNKNWWGGSTEREQRHVQISLKLDRKKKQKTKKLDRYATTEIYPFISLNSYSCVCILNIQAHLIYLCFAYTVFPTNGRSGATVYQASLLPPFF